MPYASKDKQNEYKAKYDAERYTVLGLKMAPGDADFIRRAATAAGLSYSQYVLAAVREKVERDKASEDTAK